MSRAAFLLVIALAGPAAADPVVSQRIDREIAARLRAAGVVPAGRADDATLVRRVYLDLLGRPPTEAEADAFLADPKADKVHQLIDRLRLYPEAAAHWRRVIADWLHAEDGPRRDSRTVMGYLAVSVGRNMGWDRLARDLLDPDPDDPRHFGASNYLAGFLDGSDPKAGAEAAAIAVGSAFFGVQLQCARCHDHPRVPEWTKARFDGLVAVFRSAKVSHEDGRWVVRDDPSAAKPAKAPVFLDGAPLEGAGSLRARLVRHTIRPEAAHFKRAAVNRVWKQLLGRGLVEPVDMIHAGNPASHPELFEFLADDFAAHGFDFDRLLDSVMHSEAYLRSSRWTGPADRRPPPELFAVAELRPLSGPQMAWAVATATGLTQAIKEAADPRRVGRGPGVPIEVRYAWESTDPFSNLSHTFRAGRAETTTTAGQAILLAFDPALKGILEAKADLPATLANEPDDEKLARRLYLTVLARRPTPDEVTLVRECLRAAATRRAGCEDLVWALVAGAEFRLNH